MSNSNNVRLVTGDEAIVVSKSEALSMAYEMGMDLVLIDDRADPPVVKIMDEGKYNYELQKKKKRADKKQKQNQSKMKEVQIRPVTGDHDIKIKCKNINDFLGKGHSVKISVRFRGREVSHIEMANNVINKLFDHINSNYVISYDSRSGNNGKDITIILENVKE